MHPRFLDNIGDKLLGLIIGLLSLAIITCASSLWKLSSTVEVHEVRLQAIESRYAQVKDLKNMELIAGSGITTLKESLEKLSDKQDRIYEKLEKKIDENIIYRRRD